MKLYLIRHGKTLWNEKDLLQGKSDIPLSKDGIEKAKKLITYFKNKKIDMCFSSPLERAYMTAKIVFPNLNVIKEDKIIERNLGEFEGKSKKKIVYMSFGIIN